MMWPCVQVTALSVRGSISWTSWIERYDSWSQVNSSSKSQDLSLDLRKMVSGGSGFHCVWSSWCWITFWDKETWTSWTPGSLEEDCCWLLPHQDSMFPGRLHHGGLQGHHPRKTPLLTHRRRAGLTLESFGLMRRSWSWLGRYCTCCFHFVIEGSGL